jgi:hypothetical protein
MADIFLGKKYIHGFGFFNKYDNPRITYQEIVKIYQWSKVLHAPHSHITISSIYEQISFLPCLKHEGISA